VKLWCRLYHEIKLFSADFSTKALCVCVLVNGASRSEQNTMGLVWPPLCLLGVTFALCFEMKNKELLDNIVLTTITEDAGCFSFIYPCTRNVSGHDQNEHTLVDSTNIERQERMRRCLFLFFSNQMRPKTTIV
jgi:hypothetical protein